PTPWSGSASFFFFQAEDGIRDFHVTGVQTCALPIYMQPTNRILCHCLAQPNPFSYLYPRLKFFPYKVLKDNYHCPPFSLIIWIRSEERRVGKECRAGRSYGSYDKEKLNGSTIARTPR